MHQKTSFLFVLLIFLGAIAPLSVHAAAKEETIEIEMNIPVKAFSRNVYTVGFFNNPNISESDFTMRLASPGSIVGCASTTEAEHEKKINAGSLKLEVTDPELEIPGKRRYDQYDCEVKNNVSVIDVPLNRDNLIQNKVKELKLKSKEYGPFLDSDIKINKEKIELSATLNGQSSIVSFWFYPKNTVMLHAPQAKSGSDVKSFIRDFGASFGLTQLEDKMDNFTLPEQANNYVFFYDKTGKLIKELGMVGKHIKVGEITPSKAIYGPNGLEQRPYTIDVMATLPGQAEQ